MNLKINSTAYIVKGGFNDNNQVWQQFLYLVRSAGLTMLANTKYEFYPQGFSGVCIIGESHVAIHTYPELNQAYIVVATCGDNANEMSKRFRKVLNEQWQIVQML